MDPSKIYSDNGVIDPRKLGLLLLRHYQDTPDIIIIKAESASSEPRKSCLILYIGKTADDSNRDCESVIGLTMCNVTLRVCV